MPSDWSYLQRFIQDPYATTFGGFSKVTNFFRGAVRHPESPLGNRSPQDAHFPHSADEEPGFELITCVSYIASWLFVYKCWLCINLKRDCVFHQGAELGPRPEVKRGKPLDNWDQFLDPEGRVTDPQKVKELVFRGVRLCFSDIFLILCTCHKPMTFPLIKIFPAFSRALFHLCGRRCGSSYWGSTRGTAQPKRERTSFGWKRKLNTFFFNANHKGIKSFSTQLTICSCCGFLCHFSLVLSISLQT